MLRLRSSGRISGPSDGGVKPEIPESVELFMLLGRGGGILECSPSLRRRLRSASVGHEEKSLADLALNNPPWLKLPPDQWPAELSPLEFAGVDGASLTLCGVMMPQASGWLVVFVDISMLAHRQQDLERRHRLLRQSSRIAARLRSPGAQSTVVLDDWLEQLALSVRAPWLVVLVHDGDGWQVYRRYPAQKETVRTSAADFASVTRRSGAGPEQFRGPVGDTMWAVPHARAGRVQAWLCSGFDAHDMVPWLDDEDWQQLFEVVAAPLLQRLGEERLSGWRRRHEALERMSSGGWWEYHPSERMLRVSAALARQMSLPAADETVLPLASWLKLLAPIDRDEFSVRLDAGLAHDAGFVHTARLRLNGTDVWYRFEGGVVDDGNERHLLGFAFDVSRARERELEADATKARLAGLVDSAPGVIYVQHYDEGALQLVFCSASLETLLGWTLEDLRATSFIAHLHPDDRELYLLRTRDLLTRGCSSVQYRVCSRAGDYRWIQDEARLLRDEQSGPKEVIGLLLDVTETKEVAERVFRSEESYRLLVDDSPAIICRYRPDLQVIFANPTLASALNIERDQVEGLNLGEYLSDAQRKEALDRLQMLSPAEPFASSEICIHRSDMTHRWWVLYERGLFDDQGKLLEVQAVGRDNTEVHQTRQQLFQSAKMATLGEMAAGLAHEINQPLSVIQMTLTNLLARVNNATATPPYLVEKLERIAGQVQRAAGIVNHVCIFGRWSGVEGVMFRPARCVEGALGLIGQKLTLLDIAVTVDDVVDLPMIKGQQDRLEQVLINLIMNASYALRERKGRMPDMKPYIRIRGEVTSASVRLLVEDNGGGIPSALLGRIFEPFFTTKPLDEGTGLGLSVSREIISQMSGSLRAENHADGARFVLELPLRPDGSEPFENT